MLKSLKILHYEKRESQSVKIGLVEVMLRRKLSATGNERQFQVTLNLAGHLHWCLPLVLAQPLANTLELYTRKHVEESGVVLESVVEC
jgi:hypothetical protein